MKAKKLNVNSFNASLNNYPQNYNHETGLLFMHNSTYCNLNIFQLLPDYNKETLKILL